MMGSLYLLWIAFLALLFYQTESTWPTIASRFKYKQILQTKTLMANIISPSKDQLAVVYKSGVQFYKLDVQIYNISGSSLIPFMNQTYYTDTPKKIFWLNIGYFMVVSISLDSAYRIIFFEIGKSSHKNTNISAANIYWNDWAGVLQEGGIDYLFSVKNFIATKYKILGIDKFQIMAIRNVLLSPSYLPSDVINWMKFKHLDCYSSRLLKQNNLIPYLQCLDFSNSSNDSFKLQPRGDNKTNAIKYLAHPDRPQIYAIFDKGEKAIYQISVSFSNNGSNILNDSIVVKPFGKVNSISKFLSIDFFGSSVVVLAQIQESQTQPERVLLFYKIEESLLFYQILRIQKKYQNYIEFNGIGQLSKESFLINFNYQAPQFTRILLMFTDNIKLDSTANLNFLIITSCAFYGLFVFLAYHGYQSWHFSKLHLKKIFRQYSFVVEFICFFFVYLITVLQVRSTDLKTQAQVNFKYYSNSRLVGSYFTRLLYHLFYFTTTISMIFELYYQFEYADKHLGYHIKHGLRKIHYVCYRTIKTYIKAFVHSIFSVFLIYWLEINYCLSSYKVFQADQLLLIIIIYQVSMVSAIMFAILASKAFSSFWLAASAILLVQFEISYLVQTFYMMQQVQLVEYVLIFIWPQAVFYAFLQATFSIQLRYLQGNIEFEELGSASVALLWATCLAYFLVIKYQLYKKDFHKLVNTNIIDEESQKLSKNLSRNGFNISDNQDEFLDIRYKNPFLEVFIPCKLNLKNRLEKNNILQEVSFTAGKGQQGEIHSFIDFGNESKAALFKILINDQQSDTQIQDQIEGYVRYRQKVSLSYCFDKDIFYPELSVRQHLRFYAFLKDYKGTAHQIQLKVQQILNEFNIPQQFSNKRAKNLSGGYLKKMCLACAFIGDPQVIILDEPTVGLDLKFQKLFWQKIRIWKRKKLIIVFTSNVTQAQSISDKIWYFEKARLLDYHQMQMKKKKLEISLQFTIGHQLHQAGEMIRNFKESTYAIEKKYKEENLFRSQLLIYRFQSKVIREKINNFIADILNQNKKRYTCHLSFKITQNLMGPKELVQYYQSGQKQRFDDREQLIQLLKTNLSQNSPNRYSGMADNEDYEGVQIINKLKNINRVKSRIISQIKAVIYRRNTMRKNLNLNRAETIVTQLYLWLHLIVIVMTYQTYSANYDSRQELLKSISIYLILHSKMNHFYIKERVEEYKDSQQSIGLSYKFYWLGNFIFDFCNLFLPILISIAIILVLQFFLSVTLIINISQLLFTSFIFCSGYLLTVIILNQFLRNEIQMHTVLMSFLLYPLYLHEDSYFDLCKTNKQSFFIYIGMFIYPWTTIDWFLDKSSHVPYISLAVQFVASALIIFLIEIIKKIYRNKESHRFFKNYVNQNNKFIDYEKNVIENCSNTEDFIIGQNIIKFYDKNQCLKNIYFRVKKGEMIGFFGHNGCGKTTLFKIIVGRLTQSSGIIKYFGKQKKDLTDSERLQMSYCPQLDQFDHNLTLQQNIRVIGKIKGLDDQYISRFIAVFARFLKLKGNEQVLMGQLSVNERKKANIMAAFLGFPKIIVLDQTSTGLDSDTSQRILRLLKLYAKEFNNCVLLTSHNIPEGEQFCDRVVIIKDGVIKASGTPLRLKDRKQQERYKLVVYFKRGQNLQVNKWQLIQYLKQIEFKIINIEEKYRLGYSFDMHRADLLKIFKKVWHLYENGCIEKFSFYKHDLEQVAKFNMSQEENDASQSIIID